MWSNKKFIKNECNHLLILDGGKMFPILLYVQKVPFIRKKFQTWMALLSFFRINWSWEIPVLSFWFKKRIHEWVCNTNKTFLWITYFEKKNLKNYKRRKIHPWTRFNLNLLEFWNDSWKPLISFCKKFQFWIFYFIVNCFYKFQKN